jgi:hypothetical protein
MCARARSGLNVQHMPCRRRRAARVPLRHKRHERLGPPLEAIERDRERGVDRDEALDLLLDQLELIPQQDARERAPVR